MFRRSPLAFRKLRHLWQVPGDSPPTPTITSVSPASGALAGGTTVTITGTGFKYPNSTLAAYIVTQVNFGSSVSPPSVATNLNVISATQLTCVTPAEGPGTVDVYVRAPGGIGYKSQAYTFNNPQPVVNSVTANNGSTAGGLGVTLSGVHFTGATSVTFGGASATSVMVVNDTTITCNTPAHLHGAVTVAVTTPSGTGSLSSGFTYNPVVVSSLSVTIGDIDGGYAQVITGSGFTGASGATIGGTSVTGFSVANDTTINCTVPAHASGANLTVTVTTAGDSGSLTNAFEYFSPAQLSVSGWWRANYGGAPWTPTASAGGSGSNGNLVAGTAPSTGATQNGYTPAAFNASSSQYLQSAHSPSTYLAVGAGTVYVLAYVVSAPATSGTSWTDPTLCGTDGSVEMEMTYSSSGFVCHYFDGSHHDTPAISFSTGAYHLFQLTWNGSTVSARVDGGSAQTTSAGSIDTLAQAALNVGVTYDTTTAFTTCRMLELLTASSALSTATLDKIRAYANTRYGVSV